MCLIDLLSDSSQVQILPLPHTVIQYYEFHHCLCNQSLSFSGILCVLNGAVCFLENFVFIEITYCCMCLAFNIVI